MGISGKRRALLITLVLIVPVIILLRSRDTEREPTYQGKPLSFWTEAYWWNTDNSHAKVALQNIGTNAFPFLVRWLQEQEPNRPKWLSWSARKLPNFMRPKWAGDFYQSRQDLSVNAFEALRDQSAPAIPELARLAADASDPDTRSACLSALSRMGSNGVPALLEALANPAHPQRDSAASSLGYSSDLGPYSNRVVHVLLSHLRNKDISSSAFSSLRNLKARPDIVVPELITCLSDADDSVRYLASITLSAFGTNAQSALPALTNSLTSPHIDVRTYAASAIQIITVSPEPSENSHSDKK